MLEILSTFGVFLLLLFLLFEPRSLLFLQISRFITFSTVRWIIFLIHTFHNGIFMETRHLNVNTKKLSCFIYIWHISSLIFLGVRVKGTKLDKLFRLFSKRGVATVIHILIIYITCSLAWNGKWMIIVWLETFMRSNHRNYSQFYFGGIEKENATRKSSKQCAANEERNVFVEYQTMIKGGRRTGTILFLFKKYFCVWATCLCCITSTGCINKFSVSIYDG